MNSRTLKDLSSQFGAQLREAQLGTRQSFEEMAFFTRRGEPHCAEKGEESYRQPCKANTSGFLLMI